MEFKYYSFLSQYLIFLIKYEFVHGKPMIGHNIRHARTGEYSYVASFMKITPGHPQSGGTHYCSGVLITKQDVLTASHCIEQDAINEVQIIVGTIDLRDGQKHYPYWWITYNQWAVSSNISREYPVNDVANARLIERVHDIIPIRLSRLSNTDLYNAEVTLAGWGTNNHGIIPNIMNVATLQVIENNVCENRIGSIIGTRMSLDVRMMCTIITPYVLIEDGDSGGPLIFRNRLIGLNKGVCPTSVLPLQDSQFNIHIGTHFYRNFVNYMKNH